MTANKTTAARQSASSYPKRTSRGRCFGVGFSSSPVLISRVPQLQTPAVRQSGPPISRQGRECLAAMRWMLGLTISLEILGRIDIQGGTLVVPRQIFDFAF